MILTVRQWFRLQRVALWDRGDLFQATIERLAAAAIDHTPLPSRVYVWEGTWLIFDLAEYETHERLCALLDADMRCSWYITKADLTK